MRNTYLFIAYGGRRTIDSSSTKEIMMSFIGLGITSNNDLKKVLIIMY